MMNGSVVVLERTVEASREEIWAILMDPDQRRRMLEGVDDIEITDALAPEHLVLSARMGHDPIQMTMVLSPQRVNGNSTRVAMTMHAEVAKRSILGQAMWQVWGGFELARDRRALRRDLDAIAGVAEMAARSAA